MARLVEDRVEQGRKNEAGSLFHVLAVKQNNEIEK